MNFSHLDGISETLPSNHHHTLLFIPHYSKAENPQNQKIIQVLSITQNAHVKLMTVSYPENFVGAETNKSTTSTISVRGENMQSLMKKTTEGLVCNFTCAWEYEKHNSLGTSVDTEKALFLFQRLVGLEKLDALLKDDILSYKDLLQKPIGQIYLSEHSLCLDIDLGVTNAQCTCFEFLNQPLPLIGSTPQGSNDYTPQLCFL